MIDLRILRDDPDLVRASQEARGADPGAVDRLLAADVERRSAVAAGDSLRAEQKAFGRTIGKASPADRPALLERGKEMAAAVRTAEAAESVANQELAAAQLALPNIIAGAPPGGEQDFKVIKHVGEPAELDFAPKDHLELGESLAAIDMERGAKVSGARFYFLRGVGAQLQWAMLTLAVNKAIANGFIPMIPPVLVKPESMEGTGFLGEHADEVYRLAADDLYLVGTSEVPLAAYHSNEILDLATGPARSVAGSRRPRWRRGS